MSPLSLYLSTSLPLAPSLCLSLSPCSDPLAVSGWVSVSRMSPLYACLTLSSVCFCFFPLLCLPPNPHPTPPSAPSCPHSSSNASFFPERHTSPTRIPHTAIHTCIHTTTLTRTHTLSHTLAHPLRSCSSPHHLPIKSFLAPPPLPPTEVGTSARVCTGAASPHWEEAPSGSWEGTGRRWCLGRSRRWQREKPGAPPAWT